VTGERDLRQVALRRKPEGDHCKVNRCWSAPSHEPQTVECLRLDAEFSARGPRRAAVQNRINNNLRSATRHAPPRSFICDGPGLWIHVSRLGARFAPHRRAAPADAKRHTRGAHPAAFRVSRRLKAIDAIIIFSRRECDEGDNAGRSQTRKTHSRRFYCSLHQLQGWEYVTLVVEASLHRAFGGSESVREVHARYKSSQPPDGPLRTVRVTYSASSGGENGAYSRANSSTGTGGRPIGKTCVWNLCGPIPASVISIDAGTGSRSSR